MGNELACTNPTGLLQGIVSTVSVSVCVCSTFAGCWQYSENVCAPVQYFCRALSVQTARPCTCAGFPQGVVSTVSTSVRMRRTSQGCFLYSECVCAHVQDSNQVLSVQRACMCASVGLLQGVVCRVSVSVRMCRTSAGCCQSCMTRRRCTVGRPARLPSRRPLACLSTRCLRASTMMPLPLAALLRCHRCSHEELCSLLHDRDASDHTMWSYGHKQY